MTAPDKIWMVGDFAAGLATERSMYLHDEKQYLLATPARQMAEELAEALRKISEIEDEMYGGDWDEIEKARKISSGILAKLEESK